MEQKLPRHIAVIPDGNRRWAKHFGLTSFTGHLKGRERFHEISKFAFDLGIPYFTFWAMSEDNLSKRASAEINGLISLMQESLCGPMADDLLKNQIRLRVLGGWKNKSNFDCLAHIIDDLENKTRLFDKHNLTILLGYNGTTELVEAVQKNLYFWFLKLTGEPSQPLDFETIRQAAWTSELPPVDIVIRTGETQENWSHNSSGFMMLHATDSETRYSKTLWPNFSEQEFKKIVEEYGKRERKFGK
ncbi:MAG: di-trans,poly-cis-decaprenylcistransferase [Candidatus Yanofskybacteria bacterium]|nr:di-trans,poly-cis-decaprenylcistransferase [Candidatus Yanofskybacteria bacterium]